MPPPDTMYCSQQIAIPTELPDILKQYTKAAIRTQPKDVLQWSAAYFSALSKGEPFPVKERVEMYTATQRTDSGLTPGLLKVLHQQLSHEQTCSREELQKKWKGLCLPMMQLETIMSLGNFSSEVHWMHFLALGCSSLGGTITSALKFACELLTEEEEGSAARIRFDTFASLYTYLAGLDGEVPPDHISGYLDNLRMQAALQGGMVKPSDFVHLENVDMSSPATVTSEGPSQRAAVAEAT
ncbi:ropporin-1-like protein isoform X1 [Gadus chalcogrammus]|uniref:ropporin-1-like protein isoform X1 n=1 Tax=Gadus chalcogrammus TaxID=1042646 RepID=UPI0024C49866|nr:ropporin-1-like protein isoform X1 [Gadus chalcogrammus]XP_056440043.1 ropporin-1-like protein isoform X1 [Gadus chalcogrammus]